jgi:hypothetical protein
LRGWAVPAALAAAVAAAYATALTGSFQFDDWTVVVQDPRVQGLSAWWDALPGIRPLLKLTYAAGHALGSGPVGFHAFNVMVHALNAVIVYTLFAVRGRAAAAIAALIFALVPIQTEGVTYVSGRSTSLAALFALSSLLAWTKGRTAILSPALFAASLMVKEFTIVVPAAVALWEVTGGDRRGWWRAMLGHAVVVAVAVAAALASPTYRHLFATSLATRPIAANLATQAEVVPYLARQIVRPDLLNADPALPAAAGFAPASIAAAAFIVALAAAALASVRRHPVPALGVLWFLLWLAPTNSLLPRLDVVNDRQAYVAMIGPAWIAGSAIAGLARTRARVIAAAVAIAIVLGTATIRRNEVYRSEIAFWEDVTRKAPHNARAFNNLGYAYALEKRDGDAAAALRRALEIDPGYVRAAVNLRLLREGALGGGTVRP